MGDDFSTGTSAGSVSSEPNIPPPLVEEHVVAVQARHIDTYHHRAQVNMVTRLGFPHLYISTWLTSGVKLEHEHKYKLCTLCCSTRKYGMSMSMSMSMRPSRI